MLKSIKKGIKDSGLKKSHIAKNVGLSPAQLSQYLSEAREMPSDVEFKLRTYLSI